MIFRRREEENTPRAGKQYLAAVSVKPQRKAGRFWSIQRYNSVVFFLPILLVTARAKGHSGLLGLVFLLILQIIALIALL